MSIKEVNKESFEAEIKNNEKVLIDFFATWCPPCNALSPIIEEFAKENDNIKVLKINVDNNQELAIEYNVMKVPTLIVIKNGKEINRNVGVISKEEIDKLLY